MCSLCTEYDGTVSIYAHPLCCPAQHPKAHVHVLPCWSTTIPTNWPAGKQNHPRFRFAPDEAEETTARQLKSHRSDCCFAPPSPMLNRAVIVGRHLPCCPWRVSPEKRRTRHLARRWYIESEMEELPLRKKAVKAAKSKMIELAILYKKSQSECAVLLYSGVLYVMLSSMNNNNSMC